MTSVSSMASITSGPSGGHVERLLAKHKEAFLRELDLDSVLPPLMDKGIFETEEKYEILNCKTNEERVSKFVELLSCKGIGSFHDFCSSLEKSHPHLLTSFLLDSCTPDFASSPTPFDDAASTMTINTTGLEEALRERDVALSEQTSLRRERNEAQRRVEELRAERDALAGVINANFTKGSSVSPNLNRTNNSQLQLPPQSASMTNSRDSLVDTSVNGGANGGGAAAAPPVVARSRSPNRRLLWEKLRALEAGAANFVSSSLPGGGGDAVDGALQGIDVGARVSWDVHSVTLTRVPPFGFGIAVSGGRDNPHFEDGDPSIAISDVLKGGPAEKKLRINDRIVSANGSNLENVDHHQAIELLKESGETVNIVIKRRVVTPELVPVTVNLTRTKKKEDFGLVLGYQLYVREIVPNSLAATDGSLHESDVVVKINSTPSDMLSLVEARKQIEKAKEKLSLSVLRMALPDSSGQTIGRHSRNASQLSELGYLPEKDVNSKANTLTTSSVSPRGNNNNHSASNLALNGRGSHSFLPISPDDSKPSNLDRRPPPPAAASHNNNLLLHNGFADAVDCPQAENYAYAISGVGHHHLASPTDLGSPILPAFNNAVNQEFIAKASADANSPPSATSTPAKDDAPPPPPPKKFSGPVSAPPPPVETYFPFVPRTGVDAMTSSTVSNQGASTGHYSTLGRRRSKKRSTSSGNDPEPRTVCFRKTGSGIGFRLAGGNKTGVFVSNVQPSSTAALAGLQAGEKIVRVNEIDVGGLTREEALLLLLGLQDNVQVVTQFKREEFDEIVTNSLGDSLFMRAFFDYSPKEGGEMSFVRGDVFHVTNTLHNGVVGAWQAARVGRGNTETQRGIIPNKTRAEQIAEDSRRTAVTRSQSNITSGTASVGRRASWFRRRSKRSKSLSKDHWDDVIFAPVDPVSGKRPAYERVALKHPGFVRPIVMFGPVADVARHLLLRDAAHAFESPQVDAEEEEKKKGAEKEAPDAEMETEINTPKSGIIKIKQIKEILKKDKHCLLDVTPAAVERLNFAQLYPIVVFLRADTKHSVKAVRSRLAKGSRKSSRKLFETSQKLESVYGHIFTSSVSLAGEDPTAWYHKLRETIDRQQRDPVWLSESALDDEDEFNDEYLFPMGTRLSFASSPDSDGEFACSSRPGSIAEDEKGNPALPPPHTSEVLLPSLLTQMCTETDLDAGDFSSTPQLTGGVADGASEEDRRKDHLLRRSFSSPSVAEEMDGQQKPSGSTVLVYPPMSPAANMGPGGSQTAITNPLKEELEARLKKQGMESGGGHRGSIAMGTTSARMRSNQHRDEQYIPKGVNAIATIRSTKKHGSAQEQLDRQMSTSSQMSAMQRLRPGVTTLPSKPSIKTSATNGAGSAAPLNDSSTGENAAEVLNASSHSQGSAGGTIKKTDSFKNHDPYRFTRSTAYPYNTDSIDRVKIKKNRSHKLSGSDSPTSPGPIPTTTTMSIPSYNNSIATAVASPLLGEPSYFLPTPPSPPSHPAPNPPLSPSQLPPPPSSPPAMLPPPSPPLQPPPDIPKERIVGGSLKLRPNVPPKPRGFSLKIRPDNRMPGPPSYLNTMTQSDYGRFPLPHPHPESNRRPPPPIPSSQDVNGIPQSPPLPPPPADLDRQPPSLYHRPKSYPNKEGELKELEAQNTPQERQNPRYNSYENNPISPEIPLNRTSNNNNDNIHEPHSAPAHFTDPKQNSNPYFPPPPAFSDQHYQQQHLQSSRPDQQQHRYPSHESFPPPPSALQYPSSSTPISSASHHPPPPPQYQNLNHRDATRHQVPRQPPPPPPPKSGLRTTPTQDQLRSQQFHHPLNESPYSTAAPLDNSAGPYHRPSPGCPHPLSSQLSHPSHHIHHNNSNIASHNNTNGQLMSTSYDGTHGYASSIARMDSGYGSTDKKHNHSYHNLNGGSVQPVAPSTSTFAAYGTKAPPDGVEDPYGSIKRSSRDGGSGDSDIQQQIVATARGVFDARGGTLESEETVIF